MNRQLNFYSDINGVYLGAMGASYCLVLLILFLRE